MKSSVVAQCKRSCSLNRQNVNSYSMQRDIAAVSVTLIVLGLIGCASDAPNVRYAQRMRPETRILQNDEVRAAIIPPRELRSHRMRETALRNKSCERSELLLTEAQERHLPMISKSN